MNTPSKEDLDNLFGPMFEEYYEKKSSDTPIYSAAQPSQVHEDSPYTSSIIVDTHEAPPVFVPYNPPSHEEIKSSRMALELSNVQNFHQVEKALYGHKHDLVPGGMTFILLERESDGMDDIITMWKYGRNEYNQPLFMARNDLLVTCMAGHGLCGASHGPLGGLASLYFNMEQSTELRPVTTLEVTDTFCVSTSPLRRGCQSDLSLSKHSSALLQLSFQVMKVFASNFEDRTDSDTYVT
ncbi:hypothetical protein Tco_1474732 [Tanacetum coccineum]